MTDENSGSRADGLNLAEIRRRALGDVVGGQPDPIRKRAYHRALKSGKEWALKRKAMIDGINEMWRNIVTDENIGIHQIYMLNYGLFNGEKK